MGGGKSAAVPQPRSQRGRAAGTRKMLTRSGRPRHAGRIAPQYWPPGEAGEAIPQSETACFAGPFNTKRNSLAASWLRRSSRLANKIYKNCHATAAWPQNKKSAATPPWASRRTLSVIMSAGNPYSGMLPCFFGGLLWFLLRHISRAHISLRRVSRGMMTSSMSPRSAVRYGLENSSS